MNNVLYRTKCTVIGPMQFHDGTNIRGYFRDALSPRNITVFNHYENPFLDEYVKEDVETVANIRKCSKNEEWDELTKYKYIRLYDLALIDKSDFIIMDFVPDTTMCGTWEEFFTANRMKRPIFLICEQGKAKVPAWVYWTIPHKYIYTSKEDVLNVITQIDDGTIKIDSDRWKLLKKEMR